ncbi:MAG: hypothetical protein WAT71_15210 [Ignavibacteria bacterium]
MKKIVFTLFFVCLFISLTGNSYSQSFKLEKVNQTDLTKINNPFDAVSDGPIQLDGINPPSPQAAILTALPGGTGTSGLGRAPQSSTRYQRCYYYISAEEMKLSGFPTGSITSLGFTYTASTFSAAADTFKVYFENAATYADKGTDWTLATGTMTQVHQGPIVTLGAAGSIDYTLSNPGAFNYTGTGLWVAFEYQNTLGTIGASNTVSCNTTSTLSPFPLRNMSSGSNVALANIMTNNSNFRPATRLGTNANDIVLVSNVIAYGEKLNNCIDTNFYRTNFIHMRSGIDTMTFKYVVKNVSSGFIKDSVSISFILNDTGATTNYYLTLPFAKQDSIKADSIIVTATTSGNEGITGNNKARAYTSNTYKTINQAVTGQANGGGAGFISAGLELAMAHSTGDCDVYISKVNYFFGTTGQQYELKVYEGTDTTPGALLYNSGTLVNTTGANSHTLTSPVKSTTGKFFIAFRQIAATNFSLQFQSEVPVRRGVYYTGDGTQANWGESGSGFKYNVQVETTVNLDLALNLEGFFDGSTMVGDTVTVNLRSQNSPYPIIVTEKAYVDATGNGTFNFTNASPNTCYYYEVIHRNHIRTFSNSSCNTLNNNSNSYDFKSANTQSYGPNMIFVAGANSGWATYTADVNQDDVVDLTDYGIIDNDAFNFVGGYVVTDVNGDMVVDVTDLGFSDNNAFNFIGAIVP